MSALDNMLADMLKKAIPAEIAELLTPEKIQEFGEKINGYIVDTRERLERIEVTQAAILERLENDRHNRAGKSKPGSSNPVPGNAGSLRGTENL